MSELTGPIAAAYIYMGNESSDVNIRNDYIPPYWSSFDFSKVDLLIVGPFGIQTGGVFGLYSSEETGSLQVRFNWILENARKQNKNIKIMASHWPNGYKSDHQPWGLGLDCLGTDACSIPVYTASVKTFLEAYLYNNGGIDGYDIDYEPNNAISQVPEIMCQIRKLLDDLGSANGRKFYTSVTPNDPSLMDVSSEKTDSMTSTSSLISNVDFVNMQAYGADPGASPEEYLNVGVSANQLIYGICGEDGCGSPDATQAVSTYSQCKIAGVFVYRLNSPLAEERTKEAGWMKYIYEKLHPTKDGRVAKKTKKLCTIL